MVHKGQDGGAVEQQPLALAGVGHIGQLVRGNTQLPGQNLPVTARLIEHIHEVGVFKDVLHLAGRKQVLHVLGDARGNAAPLSEPLPNLHRVGGSLFLFQEQVHLVDVVAGRLAGGPVDGDAVPHLVLDHQHPDLFQLLAQLLDVVADNAVVDVHVAAVVEHVEGAGDVDFQRRCDVLRLFLILRPQQVVQILQNGHILRARIVEVVLIHQPHTAVNDGFLHRLQSVLAAHNQFTQRQDKVGFQRQRAFIVRIVQVQVHRVDVVGGGGRNLDDLPVQALHQRRVLGLRVADDDIIRSQQEAVGDLALGAERFAAARRAQNQAIGVFQQLAVHHNQVVGQGVDAVVQRFLAVLKKLLCRERHKNSRRAGGQTPLDLHLVQPQRQAAHQAFLLLEVQPGQLAVVLLRDGTGLEDVVAQLAGIVRRVQHQERHQEHPLVAALQVLQQLLGLGPVGGKVGGDDVHVIPGADGLFLFLDLAAVQVGDLALHRLDGLHLIHRLDVQIHNEGTFHIEKIRQHPVVQLRGQNLHEADGPVLLSHAELLAGAELEAGRSDEVLGGEAGGGQPIPLELEGHLLVHTEDGVELGQPGFAVQDLGGHAQPLEVVQHIGLDTLQPGLGGTDAVGLDGKGQVLGLDEAVVAPRQLVLQHLRVLHPDGVKVIPLGRDGDTVGEGLLGRRQVQKGQLETDGAVKVVEEIAPALEDGGFIFILAELVVDVLKLDGLGVAAIRHLADAVRPHPLIGDAVLGGLLLFARAVGAGNRCLDLFSFGAGQLTPGFGLRLCRFGLPLCLCREQCHTPPCRDLPAAPTRHRSCWCGRGAAWAG